jgi:ribonuclease HI
MLKVNFDGAFRTDARQGGWGFLIRDSQGRARGSGAGFVPYASSALQMEAHACSEAVQAASAWGMGNIVLETDSAILVATIL